MQVPSEAQLLALWEQGLRRHPVDRALLLCAWARPEVPGSRLAELPLRARVGGRGADELLRGLDALPAEAELRAHA